MVEIFLVGIGGFLGSIGRYGISKLFQPWQGSLLRGTLLGFPIATLVANVIASFLFGIIIGIGQENLNFSPRTKLFLTTGIMGGLSTFSTFSVETVTLLQNREWVLAIGNISLNLVLSLTFTFVGLLLGRRVSV